MHGELSLILGHWERGAEDTRSLLRALPGAAYDLRPDAGGRSLGELAWHLAEVDAYATLGIAQGHFRFDVKPPHIERPRSLAAMPAAFDAVHRDAGARLAALGDADLERTLAYADGTPWPVRDLLWRKLVLHGVHHRGQLTLLCRLAGGVPPPLFGRTRGAPAVQEASAVAVGRAG